VVNGWEMASMKEKVYQFIHRHQLLQKNSTVLVGVSGGPDSMALLHFLSSLRSHWNLTIIAVTIDHQLRGKQSIDDVNYVRKMCHQWQIKCIDASLNVPAYQAEANVGAQVAARELRYKFFAEQMDLFAADFLALGHHGDDQVETMLMSLVRSSSARALSGIPVKRPFTSGYIIRPFLCVTKNEIEHYCNSYDIHPRIDPSNEDTTYTRNYFRKHIIPLMKQQNPNVHTFMQRLSESLQQDERFLREKAQNLVYKLVTFNKTRTEAMINIDKFVKYPQALQRRIYHLILNYLYRQLPKNLSSVHEEDFFNLLQHKKSHVQMNFPQALVVEKSYQSIIFYFQDHYRQRTLYHKVLYVPGQLKLPDGSVLRAQYTNQQRTTDQYTYICTVGTDDLPLHIRTRRDGDRMSWKGLNGRKKIKDIFIDEKIPKRKRDTWPIVSTDRGEVLWLIGLKKGMSTCSKTNNEELTRIKLTFEKSSRGGKMTCTMI